MRKLGRFLRTFWCRLRGGHIFSDYRLQSTIRYKDMTYEFRNKCLRCGHIWKTVLTREELLSYDGTDYHKRRRG